jgi:hypothetical protein
MNPLFLAGLLASTPSAITQDSPPPAEDTATRWYGWQTLIADGGSFALALLALHQANTSAEKPLIIASAALYLAGAPTVHFVHGNVPEGIGDVLYRGGIPAAAGLLGAVIGGAGTNSIGGGVYGGLIGVVAGGVAASTIDAIWLASEPAPMPTSSRPRILPTVTFWRGHNGCQHTGLALLARF